MAIHESKGVRIVSDGTPRGTHVFDREGNEITGIFAVEWSMQADGKTGAAKITFPLVSVDVAGVLKDG